MKPSQRYQLDRLARELSRPQGWLDEDPPTWDWPRPNWRDIQAARWHGFLKSALFAIRYGYRTMAEQQRIAVAGKALAALRRRMGD